jgi:Flavin containing amine oxidoreductase
VWTNRALGVPVDLGGQWIHGVEGNPIKEIAARHHVVTRRTDYTGVRAYDAAGRVIPDDEVADFKAQYDELLDRMYDLVGERDGVMTVEQGIELALDGEELTEEEERSMRNCRLERPSVPIPVRRIDRVCDSACPGVDGRCVRGGVRRRPTGAPR